MTAIKDTSPHLPPTDALEKTKCRAEDRTGVPVSPLVSIIVPAYNVEGYIEACLESVTHQTYPNIEVLVVNDGSTDGTLSLIEDCLRGFKRAKLIDKANGGLSSARNMGLDAAKGDFVLFLDGDDVLDIRCVSTLVEVALCYNADLVTFGVKNIHSQRGFQGLTFEQRDVASSEQLLSSLLLLDEETGSACGKLIGKNLADGLRFPEGQLFEDFGVVSELFSRSKRAVVTHDEFYGYVIRDGSITRVEAYTQQHVDGMLESINVVGKVIEKYPALVADYRIFSAFCFIRLFGKTPSNVLQEQSACIAGVRKNALRALIEPRVSFRWKARCLLFSLSPKLYKYVFSVYATRKM